MKKSNRPLTFLIRSDAGIGNLKVKPDHPLVTHLRIAFQDGNPPGQWAYLILLRYPNPPLVFGTFVLTVGGRVLFCPGGECIIETPDDSMHHLSQVRLEHITVDKEFRSSHIRVLGRREKEADDWPLKAPSPDSMIPWFSILLHSLDGFTILPELLTVQFPQRRPNLQEFGKQLMESQVVSAPVPALLGDFDSFFQFDIWVGVGTNWRDLKSRPLPWAYKREYVENAPIEQQIQNTVVNIELAADIGVRIHCSRPLGRLISPPGISVFLWGNVNK